MPTKEIVKSSDLGLVTALMCIGYEPYQILKENNVIYYFFTADGLEVAVDKYWHNQLNVSALDYFTQLKSVKVTIYGLMGR